MHGRHGKVEAQSPVRQDGEVGEGAARRFAIGVGALPADYEEEGDEDVDGLLLATDCRFVEYVQ